MNKFCFPKYWCLVSLYTYIYTYVYIHTYLHTYVHTYIRTYVLSTYVRTYVHAYVRTYVRTYIHTCMHTYIHTYIHTRTTKEHLTPQQQKSNPHMAHGSKPQFRCATPSQVAFRVSYPHERCIGGDMLAISFLMYGGLTLAGVEI